MGKPDARPLPLLSISTLTIDVLRNFGNHHTGGCPGWLLQKALQRVTGYLTTLHVIRQTPGNTDDPAIRIFQRRLQENIMLRRISILHAARYLEIYSSRRLCHRLPNQLSQRDMIRACHRRSRIHIRSCRRTTLTSLITATGTAYAAISTSWQSNRTQYTTHQQKRESARAQTHSRYLLCHSTLLLTLCSLFINASTLITAIGLL